MSKSENKLGFNATWSMAVGGMIGGVIFSTLAVVAGIAGSWAWFSFAVGGLIALGTSMLIGADQIVQHEEVALAIKSKQDFGITGLVAVTIAAALAAVGTLVSFVKAASLSFQLTFTVVCGLAFRQRTGLRSASGLGAMAVTAASIALIVRLIQTEPLALILLGLLILIAVFGRPMLQHNVRMKDCHD